MVEEISHQEALLQIQRRNLRALELQIAQYGLFEVPVHLQLAKQDLAVEVTRLDNVVRELKTRLRRLRRGQRKRPE